MSLVESHFEDLKKREFAAWNACYEELLTIVRKKIDSVAPDLSTPVKTEVENDVVKELYRVIDRTESVQALKAFLRRRGFYRAMDEFRRLQKLEPLKPEDDDPGDYKIRKSVPVSSELCDEADPAWLMVAKEEEDALSDELVMMRESLEQVGSPCKEILVQRYGHGATEHQIGELIGKGGSSVHNRIKTCMKRMKEIFERILLRERVEV